MAQRVQELGAELAANEAKADVLGKIIKLWGKEERGVALLDEVDMLLHPLRSELNFPIGPKSMLDSHAIRFSLPMHLLDAIFWCEGKPLSLEGFRPGQDAADALNAIRTELNTGLEILSLSRSPQLSLLETGFYSRQNGMQDGFAKWAVVWLVRNLHVRDDESAVALQYVGSSESTLGVELSSALSKFSGEAMKALNLARDWVTIFIPHTLSKVHRVSYGLLTEQTLRNWKIAEGEHHRPPPKSRRLLAVPFVALEAPSRNSEFAHPEVLIGLSILAYRYEGLRLTDLKVHYTIHSLYTHYTLTIHSPYTHCTLTVHSLYTHLKRIIRALKEEQMSQPGPFSERAASILFQSWLVNGSEGTGQAVINGEDAEENVVLPLELFEHEDEEQMQTLMHRLSHNGLAINHYLLETVFPSTMQKQVIKLQASGVDLGSDMLFGTRCGFSGTPSDLLPRSLKPCYYEPGSEAQIIRELTSPLYCTTEVFAAPPKLPFVEGMLRHIATSTQPNGQSYSALIDTGALITGLGNEGCARSLLEYGLKGKLVCVFLDDMDRKMTVDRTSAQPRPLSQCGVPLGQRFVFYDQAHTTGMDIKHDLTAMAVTTVGKDTTLRDYAQGAYRMRGLAKGQTLHCMLIPPVVKLIQARGKSTGILLNDTIAWLVSKQTESEALQNTMLTKQNLESCWRLEAFHTLLGSTCVDGGNYIKVGEKQVTRFAGASFGPQVYNVKALCVMAEPADGSAALVNDVKGKICLVRRGGAKFVNKAKVAQDAGAIGVIVINRDDDARFQTMGSGGEGVDGADIDIPSLFVSLTVGELVIDSPGVIIQMKLGGDRCSLLSRFRDPIEDEEGIAAALADKGGAIFSEKELQELQEQVVQEKELEKLRAFKKKVIVVFGDAGVVNDAYDGHCDAYKAENEGREPSVADRMAFMTSVTMILGVDVEADKDAAPLTPAERSARARGNWARARKMKGAIAAVGAFSAPTTPEAIFRKHADTLMEFLGGDDVDAMLADSEDMPLEERVELFAAAVKDIDQPRLKLDLAKLEALAATASVTLGKDNCNAKLRALDRQPLSVRITEMQNLLQGQATAVPERGASAPTTSTAMLRGMPVLQRQSSQVTPMPRAFPLQRLLSMTHIPTSPAEGETKKHAPDATAARLSQAISLFREPLELALSSSAPVPKPFSASLQAMLDEQRPFMQSELAASTAVTIIGEQRQAETSLADAGAATETSHFDGEVVQEQEQEQEQEQQQQQQQEVQVSYARNPGNEGAWAIESLTKRSDTLLAGGHFYQVRDFRVDPSKKAINYPPACLLSRSYAPRMHRADQSRRLKNVEVMLYWRPLGAGPLSPTPDGAGLTYLRAARAAQVQDLQDDAAATPSSRPGLQELVRKASTAYFEAERNASAVKLTRQTSAEEEEAALQQAISLSLQPDDSVETERVVVESAIEELFTEYATGAPDKETAEPTMPQAALVTLCRQRGLLDATMASKIFMVVRMPKKANIRYVL
jgi:hypothetical protein